MKVYALFKLLKIEFIILGLKMHYAKLFYVCKHEVGFTTSSLPEDVLKVINIEKKLEKVIERIQMIEICEENNLF